MTAIEPLAGHLVIDPLDEESYTTSGIALPETAKEYPSKGIVLATGPDTKDEKCPVEVGDTVIFRRYGGQDVKFEDKSYKIVKFSELMGIIRK